MSENFYPPPPSRFPWRYQLVGALIVVALIVGIAAGYFLGRTKVPDSTQLPAAQDSKTNDKVQQLAALPNEEYKPAFDEGSLLAYRIDAEIQGGGTESGQFSEVYMQFGSDVSLYTQKVEDDGTATLQFAFENTGLSGTFFENPFEMQFGQPDSQTAQPAPESPQTAFLTTPIVMRVSPNGEVLSISSPSSLQEMLGTIVTVPQLTFPEGELVQGRQWETNLKLPVPGIGDAIDTKVLNTLVGTERMAGYDCGVVRQQIGATQRNTQATAPDEPNTKPMLFSVPLFDLQGENIIYFEIATGRLIHAKLDMQFALRIKEQLGDAGRFLQQIIPSLSGEQGAGGIGDLLPSQEKPDLMDLSLDIDGAFSLVNEGLPTPLPSTTP